MNKPQVQPWLSVPDGERAVSFYKSAFGAVETYRQSYPDGGLVVRLSVGASTFWVSSEAGANVSLGGGTIRMILEVDDPDAFFEHAVKAGGTQVWPVGEEYGWRIGRLADPFGLNWEIGRELKKSS
jgi:PhnB protein